ncbi:hypothetical protein Tco_0800701 [Tanacetum coccineum]|uniref:Uncharacterized protein n=1 Tax=Tanacetum coccineum TaxID=301880 RepID=A0ABQ4ZU07_9ASTR
MCSVVLTYDIAVGPMRRFEPRSNCVKEHSRNLELEAEILKSKAESDSNVSSRAVIPERPKVLAPGLYAMTPKYIPPQKRNNREANTPLPRKETCETKSHRNLLARSENVKRVDNPLRNLNKRNHVDSSLSVKRTGFTSKSVSVCKSWNECLIFVLESSMWKPTGKKIYFRTASIRESDTLVLEDLKGFELGKTVKVVSYNESSDHSKYGAVGEV